MRIRSLGWAGLEIEADGRKAIIDAVADMAGLEKYVGPPLTPLLTPQGPVDLALVTHLHDDHTDPVTLATALAEGGLFLRPAPMTGGPLEVAGTAMAEAGLAKQNLVGRVVEPWDTVDRGPFRATAVPAVDGFGETQVSWVLEADGVRIFHGGDTVFHGFWWHIAMRCGPFDAVFLPTNGAVCTFPHRKPASPLPADLTPQQAAVAAHILGARLAVPIHYDAIQAEGVYEQVDDPAGTFVAEAGRLGVTTRVLAPGEVLELTPAPV
ncbi:hypothetical protein ALI144C_06410 [Actinosynnema sp. ALI-1.44]|uniref:MBL fold metallo-hydrolase n=1 Tax=Actinosynnema sp. ALI-1.44 TaxID=1933779 RepID=UPI00097BB4E7|nr:MBL fold metallo-hydrolase [Actinosynnema sp. ALI-1.44]ONI88654.1 hypothetical protein ALI144C_06410 [Actinosynnema sp. ALI-1.44]